LRPTVMICHHEGEVVSTASDMRVLAGRLGAAFHKGNGISEPGRVQIPADNVGFPSRAAVSLITNR
jgi:hypothetical protein